MFTSKELDRETGLYYFGARYQDPKLGIFISVDPLAEKFKGSSYSYAFNNPVRFTDPDGKGPFDWMQRKGEDGKTIMFYDASITTQEQATAVYGNVDIVKEGTKTLSRSNGKVDGRYSYTYHNNGNITDANNNNVNFYGDTKIETTGGTTIVNPSHKSGYFSGGSFSATVGLGYSLEAGIVSDPTGGSA